MLPNDSALYSLVNSLKPTDPVLKDLFRKIISQIQILNAETFESSTVTEIDSGESSVVVPSPTTFTYTLIPLGIKFEWDRPNSNAILFEIRRGSSWDSGSRELVTSTTSAVLDGQSVGTHTYWIRGQGIDGTYSDEVLSTNVIIPAIGSIVLQGEVIDNFVLLSWNVPTSPFRIDYYVITRGSTEVGRQTGTFHTVFENVGGTYQYGIKAVDIFGNESVVTTKDITLNSPADYVLEAIESSSLSGTRTNVALNPDGPSLIANIDETETWSDWASNGYSTFQDEIDAGFPYWLQPTQSAGEYEEVFDYGAVFDAVIVNVDWNYIQHVPTMQVECYLSTSLDNVTYSAETLSTSVYATSLRYLKLRLVFTALN